MLLCDAQVTALFCPVLLSTLTARPERDLPTPSAATSFLPGSFSSVTGRARSRGRRQIVNTYGPTEVSTDTSRQLLRPGELSPSAIPSRACSTPS